MQGLGRAKRGKSDYCAILITGTDLVSFIKDNHNRRHLSPGTNVQLELGLVIASEIKKSVDPKGFSDALVIEINRCLSRDEEWKSFYRDFLEHARERAAVRPVYEEGLAVAKTEHTAAAVFLKRDYQGAAQQIQTLVDRTTSTEREKGWFLQLSPSYLYLGDKSKALSMQKKAVELNGALFVPPDGTAYHRLADRGVSQAALSLRYRLSFPATKLAHEAVFPVDGRVVTPDVLEAFVARVRSFVVAVSTIERGALTQKELEDQLQANNLMFDRCFSGAKRVSSSRG